MTSYDNIQEVADLQPDYLGFIFHESSSRYFELDAIPELSKDIKKTGVFVNKPIAYILEKVKHYGLQAIQLHGKESPEFCKALHHAIGDSAFHPIEIIKVFSIKDAFDFSVLAPYEAYCDYFLFDTKGQLPGGNGYTFDWNILKAYPSTTPFFLSGGIGLNEVDNVLAFLKSPESKYCYAIDVNSRFETAPGLKDINELSKFIEQLSF